MKQEACDAAIDAIFDYLKNIIYYPDEAELDPEQMPENFTRLAQGMLWFGESIKEMRQLAADIARGQLDTNPASPGNEMASDLKSLQATLKHLTWQISHVTKGDYKQRVSYMGDFADSINEMIRQLDEREQKVISQKKEMERHIEELDENYRLFVALTSNISQWIIVMDRWSSEWLYTNHRAAEILHDPSHEGRLRDWLRQQALSDGGDGAELTAKEMSLSTPGVWDVQDEFSQYFSITQHPITWQAHKAIAFVITDITEEKRRREELESVAFYDMLTGAYSRHYGMNVLEKWLESGEPFVICFVDMDNLKFVNDTYGHEVGDKYILLVSNALLDFDKTAVLSRLGGDEFMLLCKGWTKSAAMDRLEGIRSSLIAESDDGFMRSISYGVVATGKNETQPSSLLLGQADELMYEYKRLRKMERRATSAP